MCPVKLVNYVNFLSLWERIEVRAFTLSLSQRERELGRCYG
jgi:hypothetical protein